MWRLAGIFLLLLLGSGSCARKAPVLSGSTMGTTYTVIIPDLQTSHKEALKIRVDLTLAQINSALSTYQRDSSIAKFNASKSTDWMVVPAELVTVADAANQIAVDSDGAFDPTIAPLVNRWGFGPESVLLGPVLPESVLPEPLSPVSSSAELSSAVSSSPALPDANEISTLLRQSGYRHLQTDLASSSIRKTQADLQLDLTAIAKGFAVDQLAQAVAEYGYINYLVEIGGELRVSGTNANGEPWQIGIEHPGDGDGIGGLALSSGGVATSGDYRNAFQFNGVRYSHIIDPRTGYPVTHTLASVTVVAKTAMLADAWATALMVLGPAEGLQVAERHDLASYFILRDGQEFDVLISSAYKQLGLSAD